MTRTFLLLFLFLVSILEGWLLLSVLAATWYGYWYPAWGLFVVTILVDGYVGQFGHGQWPILSMAVGGFVILLEILKMYLRGTAAAPKATA
jgi:hypothetical protein